MPGLERALAVALLLAVAPAAGQDYDDDNLRRGEAAVKRGDWETAAGRFAAAINDAGLTDRAEKALAHLEYGRAMGVLCQYAEAEKYLAEAATRLAAARLSRARADYELGAALAAQKKFAAAAAVLRAGDDATLAPAQAIDRQEKLALALAGTDAEGASAARRAADALRAKHPAARAAGVVTPYGGRC